jgi:hypothetical protein
MHRTGLFAALWVVFAGLTLAGGYAMLRACDLGILPLFGSSACASSPSANTAIAAERERQDILRTNLHSAEIRLAQLPICPKPLPKRPEPKKEVKIPAPRAEKKDEPNKDEPKKDDTKPVEKLVVTEKIAELKGCWRSSNGDVQMVKDDAQHSPGGKARYCYCLGDSGQGFVQVRHSDGEICRNALLAQIKPGEVFMHHDRIDCPKGGSHSPADITCRNGLGQETTCDNHILGKFNNYTISQQFIRVDEDYCAGRELGHKD